METNEQDEVIVDDVEENNEEVEEVTEETPARAEKPKRTPQEEYDYHNGKAQRLAKKLGLKNSEKAEPVKETSTSQKPNDLDYGEKAYLRSALNLKGADELQLAKEWKGKYGTSVEEMETDEVFLNRLNGLRTARESAAAVPKGKPRSGQTGVTDVDLAVAKYKETGEMPSDFATRNKVIDAITQAEKSPLFQGPSFI